MNPVLLFKQLRPQQWTKNLLVFAALIFSINHIQQEQIIYTIIGFFLFSFTSGCVYILNDYVDREADKLHPEKKFRPMASGRLNPQFAISFGLLLLIGSLYAAYQLSMLFMVILMCYFTLNVAYSFKLKHVVIIDVMVIAAGFVFRAISGAIIIDVPFTPWFLLCTMLLALFLAVGKRRHELVLLKEGKGQHRKVLESYSINMIDQMICIVTTATIMTYSLYTFTSGNTIHLMWTIPLVLYGIFRYLYLIHVKGEGGKPDKILLQDKHILITVVIYGVAVVNILRYF